MSTLQIEIVNDKDLLDRLNKLQTKNQRMEKDLRKIIRYVLKNARKAVSSAAKSHLPSDPRKAYQAVRHSVYKRIFGGQVNILSRRTNNGKMYVGANKSRSKGSQRGGNRMRRSARTNQVDSYYGSDRGFILRFLNAGTTSRLAGTRSKTMKPANRGRIKARNWFGTSASTAMEKAAGDLDTLITRAIEEIWDTSK